jgi:trehalose 6-phosphate synthase/phosphatase
MRLIIVSNRLPITLTRNKEGNFQLTRSSGGLVSGLSAYIDVLKNKFRAAAGSTDFLWVGWPGAGISSDQLPPHIKSNLESENYHPVYLSEAEMNNFYLGFCNKTIWPLFHYFPSYTIYKEEYWETYKKINEQFAISVSQLIRPGDYVWIHDYHFMLLPELLRKYNSNIRIGFFLHIPFPQYEVFSLLPQSWRSEILQGMLGADLVGFHTQDYTQYFLRSIRRILEYKDDYGRLDLPGRTVQASAFPMGIDYEKFAASGKRKKHQAEKLNLGKFLGSQKTILSIDRLDYTKGIINRLLALEMLLENKPEWRERISLLLNIIPSRIGVDQYESLKQQIDEQVGRINGKYSTMSWAPVRYRYGFLDFDSLTALYSTADVMLVTPLRDGMNLIAKEYIACRTDQTGVLILSEMAGASKELGEAVIINPNHREEIFSALEQALNMSREEQIKNNSLMQERLKKYDVINWAGSFVRAMGLTDILYKTESLEENKKEEIRNKFVQSSRGILFLDYDGTLVSFNPNPEAALPDPDLRELLEQLTNIPVLDVVLLSGRDRNTLSQWFSGLNLFMSAEHGAWIFDKRDWILPRELNTTWKKFVTPVFELYTDRLPGAFIEEKEFSLAWHYRESPPEMARRRKRELLDHLLSLTGNKDIQVITGKKVIEVKNSGINKGTAAMHFLSQTPYDFIAAIGDDRTDEDLFGVLPSEAYTIKVGKGNSLAKFRLKNQRETRSLLKYFLAAIPAGFSL